MQEQTFEQHAAERGLCYRCGNPPASGEEDHFELSDGLCVCCAG